MSTALISRSPDLTRLREEGYEIDVVKGHLLVKQVPYVDSERRVRRGTLVSTLNLAGEKTARPDTHVVFFQGDQPCDAQGRVITAIVHGQPQDRQLACGVQVRLSFSNKPKGGFSDYFAKMTSYANILSGPAQVLDPDATARTYVNATTEEESVFHYTDTATSRAEIGPIAAKLEGHRLAIVGLGGTGSYLLDLLAKTPVSEIHLYDGDRFYQHNAFRSPGAPSQEELREGPRKVEHLSAIYSKMHRGIRPHAHHIDEENLHELADFDFVFVCVDSGSARKMLVDALVQMEKPFIDVGMGIRPLQGKEALGGTVRVSTSTPENRSGDGHIPMGEHDEDALYDQNIQIADLNCLNAALAVIQWKRSLGFYEVLDQEPFFAFMLNANRIVAE